MGTTHISKLVIFLGSIILVLGGASLAKGGLYVARHEGDTLHFAEIVLRMTAGETPHFDFMTPIGFLAFAPVVALTKMGLGIGMATLLAQVLLAVICLPMVVWVCKTRLTPPLSYLFGAAIMLLCLALVHGEAETGVSISMHYNRWAWAAAFLAIVTSFVPSSERGNQIVDGVLIGAMLSVLALTKMTYFVSFAVPVALGLILRRQMGAVLAAAATGALVFLSVTLVFGASFWMAYLGDLMGVSQSNIRPFPGVTWQDILASPEYLAGTLAVLCGVMILRRSGQNTEGLLLLLLFPGFVFVTFQNFANDPQWLLLFAVLIFAVLPSKDATSYMPLCVIGSIGIALTAPSYFNLAYSPLRHWNVNKEAYVTMLPAFAQHDDLYNADYRAGRIDGRVEMTNERYTLEAFHNPDIRASTTEFKGEALESCQLELGVVAYNTAIAQKIVEAGFSDARVMSADVQSVLWMFGDVERVKQGAPWHYGGAPGFETAEYLMVPTCPILLRSRFHVLKTITESGTDNLQEVLRNPLFKLYKIENVAG